jgi:tetratricopeptide (TPR) repeat protein
VIARFVGRVRELRTIDDVLAAAAAGEAYVVAVSGEAGIGKTRLCREVASRAERNGFAVGWGTCWPDGGAPPLWPWQAVLRGLRQRQPPGDRSPNPAAELLPRDTGGTTIDPERFALFAAVADQIIGACARSPVLVVIDDAHAADPGATLLARFVARTLARHPLVLLFASRPTGADPPWGDSDATMVPLGPFDLAETEDFVRSRGAPTLAAEELRTLHELTGGHPLHLRHAVALHMNGTVAHPGAQSIRAAIAGAMAGLDPQTGHVLRSATVLGSSPTVTDVAAVAQVSAADVRAAVNEAAGVGLVRVDDRERFSFSHELVREDLHEELTVEERTDAHGRAAAALAHPYPAAPDRLARYAHHSLLAASRSRGDAERAVAACRDAAAALVAGFAYEQASALLDAACKLHESLRLDLPLAPLLVDQAEAMLRYGRLAEARQLFDRAAGAADVEHDPIALARAAAGLGGVWVNEHRHRLEWERVVGLQRRALAGLPAGEEGLRRRLDVRLAVEDVYRGGPIGPALAALDAARRLGDGPVLAEALSLCHHALLTPRHAYTRLALAEEQIAVASAAGEGMLALVGLCWRTVDAFHTGDGRAPQLLAELRERADFMGCLSVLYIVEAMEVMLLIRAGRLDEAETKAYACLDLGNRVGDADALGYLGAHLTTIRWLQARDTEMLATVEQIAESTTLNPAEFAFAATVASLAARAGHHDRARTILDRVCAPGLAQLPQSSTWLAGMLSIVEAAYPLGDSRRAREAYELLTPYAEMPITPSLAVTCFGSVERVLGLAALTYGDLDRAIDHLDRALTANRLLGNRPVTAITAADLADAVLRRQAPGDRERAATLLAAARSEADAMGLTVDRPRRRVRRPVGRPRRGGGDDPAPGPALDLDGR